MTDTVWNILRSAISSLTNAPAWLVELGGLSEKDISRLPSLENAKDGEITAPWVDEKIVSPDYLDFLREQIRIDARGPEWKELLQQRLLALRPFVGKKVLTATFHQKPNVVTLKIDPETGKPFHVEIY